MSATSGLLERFLAGTDQRLTEAGEIVATLRSAEDQEGLVRKLGRALHTLKGEARLLGLKDIARLTHLAEDVLYSCQRAGRIGEDMELVLYEAIDTIFGCVQGLRNNAPLSPEEVEAAAKRLQEAVVETDGKETSPPAQKGSAQAGAQLGEADAQVGAQAGVQGGAQVGAQPCPARAVSGAAGSEAGDGPATAADAESSPGAPTTVEKSVTLTLERVDRLTNLAGSISGGLVRNRQFLDELKNLTAVAAELASDVESKKDRIDPEHDPAKMLEACLRQVNQVRDVIRDFREHHFRLDLDYSELSDVVRAARVQPLRTVFSQYPSFARRVAREWNKRVAVQISGEDLGVDQRVLAEIAEPCLHLLRNAVVHGIETRDERIKKGKPEEGTITINARQDGELVRIEFSDDGAGINLDRVRRRAVAMGLATAEEVERMRPDEVARLTFTSGLSTAAETTELAGRGVGLDVVASVIAAMGGTVAVTPPEPGKGAKFTLIVPVSLSLTRALLIEASGQVFAIPSSSVVEVFRLSVKEIINVDGREATDFRGKLLPLIRLRAALDLRGIKDIFVNKVGVLVLRAGDDVAGFIVDRFVGEREIVARRLGNYISRSFMTSGVTTIEDGSVIVLLHVPDLLSAVHRSQEVRPRAAGDRAAATFERRILFVEDSVITRDYACGILRARGFDVAEAGDGIEALVLLHKERFDLVLTDLQMPRMDGFKLVAALRRDPKLRQLPVVVMSTLDTPEAKRMALDSGADAYLVKSDFAADTLIATIRQVLR